MLEDSAVDFLSRLLRESLQDRGDLIYLENMRKSILGISSDLSAREKFDSDFSKSWATRELECQYVPVSLNGAPVLRPTNKTLLAYCAEIIKFLQADRIREDDSLRAGHVGYVSEFSVEEIWRFSTLYMKASAIFILGGDL
jgi:hypothetical protein